jgi:hypothetical protein
VYRLLIWLVLMFLAGSIAAAEDRDGVDFPAVVGPPDQLASASENDSSPVRAGVYVDRGHALLAYEGAEIVLYGRGKNFRGWIVHAPQPCNPPHDVLRGEIETIGPAKELRDLTIVYVKLTMGNSRPAMRRPLYANPDERAAATRLRAQHAETLWKRMDRPGSISDSDAELVLFARDLEAAAGKHDIQQMARVELRDRQEWDAKRAKSLFERHGITRADYERAVWAQTRSAAILRGDFIGWARLELQDAERRLSDGLVELKANKISPENYDGLTVTRDRARTRYERWRQ